MQVVPLLTSSPDVIEHHTSFHTEIGWKGKLYEPILGTNSGNSRRWVTPDTYFPTLNRTVCYLRLFKLNRVKNSLRKYCLRKRKSNYRVTCCKKNLSLSYYHIMLFTTIKTEHLYYSKWSLFVSYLFRLISKGI